MADYALVNEPPEHPAAPGGCFLSGTDQRTIDEFTPRARKERYIDPHLDLADMPTSGRIVFGEIEVAEMAALIDWVAPEKHAAVVADAVAAHEEAARLRAELDEAHAALAQAILPAEVVQAHVARAVAEITAAKPAAKPAAAKATAK